MKKIYVCETQMPPTMVKSKDGKVHTDRYLDATRKSLTHKILVCNMKALISIIYLLFCIDFWSLTSKIIITLSKNKY